MNKTNQNIAVFIEFLVGSGLAIFFHLVLKYSEAAYIIFGIGLLLSFATYLIEREVDKTKETMDRQLIGMHRLVLLKKPSA